MIFREGWDKEVFYEEAEENQLSLYMKHLAFVLLFNLDHNKPIIRNLWFWSIARAILGKKKRKETNKQTPPQPQKNPPKTQADNKHINA